eukprot:CAMPEP_0184866470 /NCGR_PEP_ID=MMETSP0580-20130426/22495_1 /TAXON_ID=1118495 /ORGANISM="Dactyliosolen fragilissimus" /LENGTH=582 /DNA_ID=CAMNT_0027366171 /DNA_START=497 /DNA_END=2245 /DNA_ORIENTATION=-
MLPKHDVTVNNDPSQKNNYSNNGILNMNPPQLNYVQLEDIPDTAGSETDHLFQKVRKKLDNSSKDEEQERKKTMTWLQWMTGGKRGVGEVRMREAIALGGVPRSDRYASKDWLHNTLNLHNSAILSAVKFPVLSMFSWGVFISIVHRRLIATGRHSLASHLCIPTTPHSLMVSALGLLLVFRTNSAYQRFSEGRKIWERILSTARDLSRLGKLYENEIGVAKFRRVQRLLATFPYLLRFRIRPNSIMKKIDDPDFVRDPEYSLILYQDHAAMDTDIEAAAVASDEETTGISRRKLRDLYWVDKRTLPWRLLPDTAMEECARAQNRPLWVCDRMAKELHGVPDGPHFSARERLTLISKVEKLSQAIGSCERIHQTVVPLNYARHALRALTMWLLSLPFAVVKDLGLMTGPVLFIISWMLFGVYEIGYSIEDPFQGTLRLSILCDAIRRDVLGDELIRNTAFQMDVEDTAKTTLASSSSKSNLSTEGNESENSKERVRVVEDDHDMDYDDMYNEVDNVVDVKMEDIFIDSRGNVVESEIEHFETTTKVDPNLKKDFHLHHHVVSDTLSKEVLQRNGQYSNQSSP